MMEMEQVERKFDKYFGVPLDQGMPQGCCWGYTSCGGEFHKVTQENEQEVEIERIFMVAPGKYSLLVRRNDSKSEMLTFDVGSRIIFLSDVLKKAKTNYVVIRRRVYRKFWRERGFFGNISEEIDTGPFCAFDVFHLEVHLHSMKELECCK